MEAVRSLLKPKPTPQQQLREWQRRLRNEGRNIERQIRDLEKEEKKVEKAIREAAKRNDVGLAKALAKEVVRSRKAVNRLYENKAQLNSISMHLGEIVGSYGVYAFPMVLQISKKLNEDGSHTDEDEIRRGVYFSFQGER